MPFAALLYSVLVFIVIPLAAGTILRAAFIHKRGKVWFEKELLPRFAPVTITALLATLVFISGVSGRQHYQPLLSRYFYCHTDHTAGVSKLGAGLRLDEVVQVEYSVAAPGALIGASKFFFELAERPPSRSSDRNPGRRWQLL